MNIIRTFSSLFDLSNYFARSIGLDTNILHNFLEKRLGFLKNAVFKLESEYTKSEWKELLQQAYIHTSYIRGYESCVSKVIRVHCFSDKAERYLGFFTLRPIRDELRVLDFIYPNFNEIRLCDLYSFGLSEGEYAYLMGYDRLLHIGGLEERKIFTFPFFHQDSIVTVCAHADLLMISKFLYYKGVVGTIPTIADVVSQFTFSKQKRIPSKGLNVFQMLEICSSLGIHVKKEHLLNKTLDEKSSYEFLFHCLVDSGLPVIVAVKGRSAGHVILVIGHTIDRSTGKRKYIVYDDSGAFLDKFGIKSFVGIVGFENIIESCTAILYPEYEKVYLDVFKVLDLYNNDKSWNGIRNILGLINRTFFVETCSFKKFIFDQYQSKNIKVFSILGSNIESELNSFFWEDKQHYALVLEFLKDERVFYLLLDSTRDIRHFLDFKRAILSPVFVLRLEGKVKEKHVFPCLKAITV